MASSSTESAVMESHVRDLEEQLRANQFEIAQLKAKLHAPKSRDHVGPIRTKQEILDYIDEVADKLGDLRSAVWQSMERGSDGN